MGSYLSKSILFKKLLSTSGKECRTQISKIGMLALKIEAN